MIDLHTHILPGLDDGAEDLEEAVEMMRIAAADGITEMVATPHADLSFAPQSEAIERAMQDLAVASGGSPKLHSGRELHLAFEHVQDCLADPAKYALAGTRYVLVEVPDSLTAGVAAKVLDRLRGAGLCPIIAHPERSPALAGRLDILRQWADQGCLLQVTADSLLGRFGKRAGAAANELLLSRQIHVVASDAHDTRHRPPILSAAREYAERRTDAGYARLLFNDNPAAVLRNEALPKWEMPEPRTGWRRFFGS